MKNKKLLIKVLNKLNSLISDVLTFVTLLYLSIYDFIKFNLLCLFLFCVK